MLATDVLVLAQHSSNIFFLISLHIKPEFVTYLVFQFQKCNFEASQLQPGLRAHKSRRIC